MKFKNDFPANIEYILNKYLDEKTSKPTYQFECWEHHFPSKTIFKAKDKTALGLAKKINKFLTKKICSHSSKKNLSC